MTATADWTAPNGRAAFLEPDGIAWIPREVYRVALEDGRQWVIATDQRDQRRAMLTCGYDPDMMRADPLGMTWAVCWSALIRTGALEGMGWAQFQNAIVGVKAGAADDDDEPGALDPTNPDGDA